MEMQNEDKRELSEGADSSISALVIPKESQDRDHDETKPSDELDRMLAACQHPHDADILITLATAPGGLINDEVRKVACKSLSVLKSPDFPTLTALQGPFCLATEARGPNAPALLAPGCTSHAIGMKIKSSLT